MGKQCFGCSRADAEGVVPLWEVYALCINCAQGFIATHFWDVEDKYRYKLEKRNQGDSEPYFASKTTRRVKLMYLYEGVIIQVDGNKYHAAILKIMHDEPGCDTIMEHECDNLEEANVWLDDEMSRLCTGKGIWEA